MVQCYAVYVEKELVGKRVKSSKVKVLWQIAFDDDLVVHQIELRHSIVSGKREVLFDNEMVYANKALFQGTFEHRSKLAGHDVRVTVEDTFEGYLYDLIVDNIMFHRMPRKTLAELETLRTEKKTVVQTDFAAFTGKSKSALDGGADVEKKKKEAAKPKKEEDSLIDLDWDSAVRVQVPKQPVPAAAAAPQYNPFDSTFAVPSQPAPQGAYDPFSTAQPGYNSYAMPSAIPSQSFNSSYQAPPQQYYPPQPQQQAYDPFASFAQPPPAGQPAYPQQQQARQYQAPPQQQPYDPFGAF